VKLATANTLQFIASVLSALLRLRGCAAHPAEDTSSVSNAPRCASSLSADWQASGIHCGLCWQATRDGLRHMPAGPPKSPHVKNPSGIAWRGTRQPAGNRRFPARRATISVEYVSTTIQRNKRALPLAQFFRARGSWGCRWGWFWGWGSHT